MEENKYLKKFQSKNNKELEYILENKERYNSDAITASKQLLKLRIEHPINIDEVEIEMPEENILEIQRKIAREKKNKRNITDDLYAPELHSKRVILTFSVILTTIFGAVLLMYNMNQTGNRKGKTLVMVFGIAYTLTSIVLIQLLDLKANLALVFNFVGAGILNEYFWNNFIGKDFKYRRRSWAKPAIISILIIIPFLIALFYNKF